MGMCGCAEGPGEIRFQAPDGWYTIRLHPGCPECGLDAGVEVQRISGDAVEALGVMDLPELKLSGEWDGSGLIVVASMTELRSRVVDFVKRFGAEYDDADEAVEVALEECWLDATRATQRLFVETARATAPVSKE